MKVDNLVEGIAHSAIFAALGIAVFAIAFVIMIKVSPFSIRKEIEDDQNTSLAIIMGSVIIGISIIIAATVIG
jgi:uncharacterized membrane protein YjfL (UPF0719 family)